MIDFHSHIVYGVDDGAESIEDSVQILKNAENAGFKSIVLTPHYMENYYEFHKDEITERIELIRQKCIEENININLYQANEIYITNHMIELLQEGIASSINNSKYVLLELPMNEIIDFKDYILRTYEDNWLSIGGGDDFKSLTFKSSTFFNNSFVKHPDLPTPRNS